MIEYEIKLSGIFQLITKLQISRKYSKKYCCERIRSNLLYKKVKKTGGCVKI
jgi:hypothetical protein